MHPLTDRVMRSMIPRGFVSTRLRRWYPLQFRQIARPRYFEARKASFLATAPAVTVFHGLAFLRGGMTAFAPRSAPLVYVNMHCRAVDGVVALAGVIGTICGDARDLLFGWDLAEKVRQNRCIADVAPGNLNRPNLKRFLVDPEVDLAPDAPFGTTRRPATHACMCERDACVRSTYYPAGSCVA
jgi:hypothetical protein